jgi:L-threonylcarbamoyladenylate synthase
MTNTPRILNITDDDSRRDALQILQQGGVVVLPTDTLPGFSAALSNETALARIRAIKASPDDKQFVLLAASLDMVESYVHGFGCTSRAALEAVWPAPLTAVLPAGRRLAGWASGTLAVRVPAFAWLSALIEELGEAIVSTSVNRRGGVPMTSAVHIEREFGGEVDLIVVSNAGTDALASTLVDFSGDAPRVLREGDYAWPDAATGDSNPSK